MNYTELISRLESYSKRTDIASIAPTVIEMAESRINRSLRVRAMEDSLSGTIDANNLVALPADFLAIKHIWPAGLPQASLFAQTLERVIQSNRTSGTPTGYAVMADGLKFDGSGDILGVYFQKVPALQTNSTNWLSESHPEAYLYTALSELGSYTLDDQLTVVYESKAREALQAIQNADMRDRFAGPLVAAARN